MLERLAAPYTLGERLDQRLVWALAALLITIHLGLIWEAREIGVHIMRDDARYLLLAQSLREFGYHDLYRVDLPLHTLYPPGFPALLLVWGTVVGDTFTDYVSLNVLLSGAALALLFAALKRIASPGVALLALVPLVVSPPLVIRAGSLRSETAYIFFSLVALWPLARSRPGARMLFLACACALLATITRINGVTLLGALAIVWLLQRRFKPAVAIIAVSILTIGAWVAWTTIAPETLPESSYLSDVVRLSDRPGSLASLLWNRIGVHAWRIFILILPTALPLPTIGGTAIDNVLLAGAMNVSLLTGGVVLIRRWPAAGVYLFLYLASLFAWPFLRLRFLEPTLPLVVPAILLGLGGLVGLYRASWRVPAMVAAVLAISVPGAVQTVDRIADRWGCGPMDLADPPACLSDEQSSYLRAADLISRISSSDAIVLGLAPEPLYYHTGRRSISSEAAFGVSPESFLAYLEEQGVDYVLLTANAGWISDRLEPHCSRLVLEGSFPPRTYLIRVALPGETVSPTVACEAIAEHRSLAQRR